MSVLTADTTDCRRYLSDSFLKTSRRLHWLAGTRVEDGHQLPTQRPVLLSPQFQGKEAIMSAKDWFRCNLRTRSPRLQRQRMQGYGQLAGMDHA